MSNHHQRRLACGAEIVLASHNVGKLREFKLLLKESGIVVHSAAERHLPEPEETADSFEGNAAIKALAAAKATGSPALADDSGFCVEALNGAPGIYSARWAGPERDMMQAMTRVHNEMIQSGSANKMAAFKVVLCLAWPDGVMRYVTGACEGEIIWPPRGAKGHGYDPMFIPNGESRSFAEMNEEEKNRFSHRGKAMQAFLRECVV